MPCTALNKHYGVQQRAVDPKKGWKCNSTRLIGRKWSEGWKMTHFCRFKSGFWLSDRMQNLHVACNAMQNIYQLQADHSTFSQKFCTWTHVRLVRFHPLIFGRPWAHFKSPIGNPIGLSKLCTLKMTFFTHLCWPLKIHNWRITLVLDNVSIGFEICSSSSYR